VATGTPSRQRAASMMVVANPAGDGERAHAVLPHVAEGHWFDRVVEASFQAS
jgi:hypothetical protein